MKVTPITPAALAVLSALRPTLRQASDSDSSAAVRPRSARSRIARSHTSAAVAGSPSERAAATRPWAPVERARPKTKQQVTNDLTAMRTGAPG